MGAIPPGLFRISALRLRTPRNPSNILALRREPSCDKVKGKGSLSDVLRQQRRKRCHLEGYKHWIHLHAWGGPRSVDTNLEPYPISFARVPPVVLLRLPTAQSVAGSAHSTCGGYTQRAPPSAHGGTLETPAPCPLVALLSLPLPCRSLST